MSEVCPNCNKPARIRVVAFNTGAWKYLMAIGETVVAHNTPICDECAEEFREILMAAEGPRGLEEP